jgi:UDP-2,4-diacetamido-2,4,6-trideoxy-beta-L-altropyranose hydrolase
MRAATPPVLTPVALFRVDADPSIGLGHLSRCLTLAEAFAARGASCTFLTTTPEALLRRSPGARPVILDAPRGSEADAAETAEAARAAGASVVVLDDYSFDLRFAEALRLPEALWIDDQGFAERREGAVLNHNLYATPSLYPGVPPERQLLGPSFALLRDEFVAARDRARDRDRSGRPRVLVTMGGADPPGFTTKVLQALAGRGDLELRALVGGMNPAQGALVEQFGARADVVVDPPEVASHMRWADLAISAAGGTAMELCCVGVPAIVVALADNQRAVAEALAARGLAHDLGWHEAVELPAIAEAVRFLVEDEEASARMRAAQRSVVDGQGKHRVAARLLSP